MEPLLLSLTMAHSLGNPPQSTIADLARDDVIDILKSQRKTGMKAKRIQLSPQNLIDQAWKRFSEPVFQKPLAVLPFKPAVFNQRPHCSNDLISSGYSRAAQDCRHAVQNVVQQCTRFNMRYRDEWDLVSVLV